MTRILTLLAGLFALVLACVSPACAGDTTPAQLSTQQERLYLLPDNVTWVRKFILTDTNGDAILPATSANQVATNTKLDTVIANTGLSLTEVTNYISASGVSATQTGADVTGTGRYRGIIVYLDISAISGATVTCTLSQKSPGGSYISVLAGAGETAVISRAYSVYPGFTSVTNSKGDYFLPKTWRVACVVSGGTTSFTVGYQLLP